MKGLIEGCCGFRGQQRKQMSGFLTIKAGVKSELLDSRSKEASVLWPHHEETRELPWERDNARNNARCTQARKATHGLDGQHQDMDRTPRGRVSQNDRGQRQMEKVRPWCGQPSDRGRLKNRTEQGYGYSTVGVRASYHRFLGLNADSGRCNSH